MKGSRYLAFASALMFLPHAASSQSSTPDSQTASQIPASGKSEAALMKPARARLVEAIDGHKDMSSQTIKVQLDSKLTLTNGTELPRGTVLVAKVTADDTDQQGKAKLALRFDQALLKNGTVVPIRAIIVGFNGPQVNNADMDPLDTANERPNDWTAKTVQVDEVNVAPGVDLHSKITSQNSGVFVATKKDDVKLRQGSDLQLAIAPATSGQETSSGSR
jgi:hypothetical protein